MKKSKKNLRKKLIKKLIKLSVLITIGFVVFIPLNSLISAKRLDKSSLTVTSTNTDLDTNTSTDENKNIDINAKSEEKQYKEEVKVNKNIHIDNKTFFKDSLFFGDSITEGLYFYEFLDENHVIFKKGLTALKAQKEANKITPLDPKNVFIFLGNNDLVDEKLTSDAFVVDYFQLVETIKENLPQAKIHILSILPVTKAAEEKRPSFSNKRIYEFNLALEDMAKKEGITFINTQPILKNGSELHEPDGIHFKAPFYEQLLNYVKDYIIENENL